MALSIEANHAEVNDSLALRRFSSTQPAGLWPALRVHLGYQWFRAGEDTATYPVWMETGEALRSHWLPAVAIPRTPAKPIITFDWYRSALRHLRDTGAYTWFARLVAAGVENLVGQFVDRRQFEVWETTLGGQPRLMVAAELTRQEAIGVAIGRARFRTGERLLVLDARGNPVYRI